MKLCLLGVLMAKMTCSFACLSTVQYKIFPVGVYQNEILTVDFKIERTSLFEGNRDFKLGIENIGGQTEIMWVLFSYVSSYDKNQKVLSTSVLDTTFCIGKIYSDSLNRVFRKGLDKIIKARNDIELFSQSYISFCDYQQSCKLVKMYNDKGSKKEYLIHKGVKHPVDLIHDTTNQAFGGITYYSDSLKDLSINGIRVYKTKTMTLVFVHLATGDAWSYGRITSDPTQAGKVGEEGEKIRLAKEYAPEGDFKDIRTSTYQEPLLHHGYGFDLFFVE